ncbi:MAG TPA: NrfD/PsrC family molybdoenzyme membrane anchor subunit [Thermoleophilia bacterium]|nr:NrfD/PsrC family molybdoenzyme membrane anchor subunit [Thermoleophilia bacterium]
MSVAATESTLAAPARGSRGLTVWTIVLVALILLGFGVWIYQIARGLQITNMRDNVIWGLYIISFMFFVGLSAGGLIIASAGRLFGVERFAPIVRLAVVEATVTIATAALLIIPDLGHVQHIYNLVIHAHWLSPMIWDLTVILIYLALSLLYLWLYMRRDLAARGSWLALGTKDSGQAGRDRDHHLTYVLAWIALPAAVLVHSITAWIFGLQISRGFWYSAVMPPLFISSALVSGLALVTIIAFLVRRSGRISFGDDLGSFLGGLLAVFLAVEAFLVFCEVLAGYYPGIPTDAVHQLFTGRYAPGFAVEIVVGLIVPFILLAVAAWRRRPQVVVIASVLALIGIFVHRANLIVIGLGKAPIQLAPGTPLGTPQESGSSFATSSVYFPSIWEFLIVIGIVALAALVFTLAVRHLPLKERS